MLLETIRSPADLRDLDPQELEELAGEIREFIVAGGGRDQRPPRLQPRRRRAHAGPAPGLRLAPRRHPVGHRPPGLRPQDRHRAAGRLRAAAPGRRAVGLPEPRRSREHDWVENSHASTILSYAYGLAVARDSGADADRRHIVAVIGDGSMTGGMAYEALNNLGHSRPQRDHRPQRQRPLLRARRCRSCPSSLTPIRLNPVYMRRQRRHRDVPARPAARRAARPRRASRPSRPPSASSSSRRRSSRRSACATSARSTATTSTALEHGAAQRHRVRRADRRPRPHPEGPRLPAGRGRRREAPARRAGVRPGRRSAEGGADRLHAGVRRGDHQGGRARARSSSPSPRPCPARPACSRSRSASPTASSTSASPSSTPSPAAAGMAMGGLRPVVAIYSTFLTRALDQVVYDVGLHRLPVRVLPRPRRHHRRRRRQSTTACSTWRCSPRCRA